MILKSPQLLCLSIMNGHDEMDLVPTQNQLTSLKRMVSISSRSNFLRTLRTKINSLMTSPSPICQNISHRQIKEKGNKILEARTLNEITKIEKQELKHNQERATESIKLINRITLDEPGPSKSLLERLDTNKEETNPRSLISWLDNSSDKENKIPDLVSSTELIRNVETLPKSLQNYKDQGFSIADNVEE